MPKRRNAPEGRGEESLFRNKLQKAKKPIDNVFKNNRTSNRTGSRRVTLMQKGVSDVVSRSFFHFDCSIGKTFSPDQHEECSVSWKEPNCAQIILSGAPSEWLEIFFANIIRAVEAWCNYLRVMSLLHSHREVSPYMLPRTAQFLTAFSMRRRLVCFDVYDWARWKSKCFAQSVDYQSDARWKKFLLLSIKTDFFSLSLRTSSSVYNR